MGFQKVVWLFGLFMALDGTVRAARTSDHRIHNVTTIRNPQPLLMLTRTSSDHLTRQYQLQS